MRSREQVVVVTGASAGLGRAAARAFGARGAKVALLARGTRGLQGALREIEAAGGTALPIPVDVSDHGALAAAARRVEAELGPIDVWVNCAFVGVLAPVTEIRPEEFRRVTEVTYLGYVHGTQVALEHMRARGKGTIVQVGSALSYRGLPLQSAYCAAKHAVQGFTESLRCELLHERSPVRVTMVHPPAVNTPQFDWVLSRLPRRPRPVPPVYEPETVARSIVHAAARPRRRQYWVGGSTVGTLLANRIAPGLLDRYLARTGYASQQTDEPADPAAPANLWDPADGPGGRDHGTRGRFSGTAHGRSAQAPLSRHHGTTAAAALAGAVLTGVAVRRLTRR
ncbi:MULTISPECIES: SDR family oxidoreductase [unclassified Streptomyces]|uniref:SDR family oxidoreductase n=1 Tax=unclassified Streptomyces TaxID=2593676 RepID=UPI0022B70C9E|nr:MULTISPECIES: SDR family oxidoreductase [unclassified Streptomyces]MCZ7413240.1 SDR family oxidoreductase [Streptomyces sp. WMMC897]MCZ7430234.1 SDR family oxidoreductase [Streptomyces sp. WMMC1477]